MRNRPNLLFMSIDALRPDRMSLHGYTRPTTPNLERLAERGLVCDRAFSPAPFTQAAMPVMLTSSPPLSFGGYDKGGFGRPPTLFKAFHDAGYEVEVLSSFKWISRFFGYGAGVDQEYHLFSPKDLVGASVNRMKSSLQAFHRDNATPEETLAATEAVITEMFDALEAYCETRLREHAADREDFAGSLLVEEKWDFNAIGRSVKRHRHEFDKNPVGYIGRHLNFVPKSHQWIAADWRYSRRPEKLASEALFKIANTIIGAANPRLARLRASRFKGFVDGASLAKRLIRHLESRARTPERPFVLYTHFLDCHVPYYPGRSPHWYRQAPHYLKVLGYDPDTIDLATMTRPRPQSESEIASWRAAYDAAVLYADEQIGRVIDALERLGLADNTTIAICADHGEELMEHGNISHYFRLYDHNCRVPMMFAGAGVRPGRIEGFTSLLDFAPTVAALAGVEMPTGWAGIPVTDPSVMERDHTLLETFYGGNCLFDRRPLYFAVRSRHHKYIWKESRDPDDAFSPDGHELYDVVNDPLEQRNLYRPDDPLIPGFNRLIAARMSEIPEIAPDRRQPLLRLSPAAA